ncbi:MAG: sigma-70 family RNA polymerase sigma factor [Candidatus Cloacimonetes bacterium]|nr:sigma-70 family RNA polymerase sigma factor [Candidatus Cloacimonadota bacterium]
MHEAERSVDGLVVATYEELRRLAARMQGSESSRTLDPTALVNEAYLKLAGGSSPEASSRLHFKRIAARAMRQVLIEAARRRLSLKRVGSAALVTLDDGVAVIEARSSELLALDEALTELEAVSPRQARMIEYRYFAGMDVAETAAALGVSEATVQRDWRAARAWLAARLRDEP